MALHACAWAAGDETLSACANPPPWTFMVNGASGSVVRAPGSFSLDMLEAALARIGRTVRFVPTPWARCLLQVEAGEIDFALGAYYSEERAHHFAFSVPYSKATPQVFFLRSRPVHVDSTADLHHYRGCGLHGASYGHYGLSASELDQGANSHEHLIAKLREGHCDYFVEELEVIEGFKRIGKDYLADPELMHGPVPGAVAPTAHLISGLGKRGAALMPQIDQALQELIRSGQAGQFWRRHTGDIPYQAP